jgi:hypothetical protein
MKRMNKWTSFLMAALLILAACTEQEVVEQRSGTVKITAQMGEFAQTRTCVDESGESAVTGILWMPEEKLGVYGSLTKNALFISQNKENAGKTTFVGELSGTDSRPVYACYPYSTDNNGQSYTAVKGSLPLSQDFSYTDKRLSYDYKVGICESKDGENSFSFKFTHLFSLLRFNIDATGTALAGDQLESITITLPEGRRLGGDFTTDLSQKGSVNWTTDATACNELTMNWTDHPALEAGNSYTGYITCAPEGVRQNDRIKVTIRTKKSVAVFTRAAKADFVANSVYTFPLTLSNYNNGGNDDLVVTPRPVITSFAFDVKNNAGKILDTELYYNNTKTTTRAVTSRIMSVEGDNISGCIPYLYDFTLIPTFTTSENTTVTVGGVVQKSGETAQDFSKPVEYVVNCGNDTRTYTVSVTNTGLPVVVLKSGNTKGSYSWSEAGLTVKDKTEDWAKDDRIVVYNADGTENLSSVVCGFRLRGNSTKNFPKKPFAIKLDKKANLLNIMADGGKHKRWCLLANWIDRSLIRNTTAFAIAHQTENAWKSGSIGQGLIWNPSGKSVELVIDGRHLGNYFLCEQVKIDSERLNINPPYEDVTNPTFSTCGYLIEFDDNYDENCKFVTSRGLPCMLKDDVPADYLTTIKTKVKNIESYLNNINRTGYYTEVSKLLDINSVIDWWLVHELTMNDEYRHPKSVYMYINGDGKLSGGPVWDFDYQTFPNVANINSINSSYGKGNYDRAVNSWLYGNSSIIGGKVSDADAPYMWYPLLFKNADFRAQVKTRWAVIKSYLDKVPATILEAGEKNMLSEKYNFSMWPVESEQRKNHSWYIDFSGDERITDYRAVIENLKTVYLERLDAMNTMITNGDFVTNAK